MPRQLNYHTNFLLLTSSLFLLPTTHAGSIAGPFTFKVGIGRTSGDTGLNLSELTTKGYTVNSYSRRDADKHSYSFSASMQISSKINAELGLQDMGKEKTLLDINLPSNTSTKQATEDIVGTSYQQVGGLFFTVGANYIQPIHPRFNLRLGAGMLLGKDDHRVTVNGEDFDYDDSSHAPYLKLGLGVKVAQGFTITAHTERYFFDDPIDRYEVGLTYTTR